MDVKYINPFIDATIGVFEDFFSITPKVMKPYWFDSYESHDWEVSAIIGIAGEARGCVVLSFSGDSAVKLTSILTGTEIQKVDDDVLDTIGEVVNIIAGNAKKGMEDYKLMISLPSVVQGKNHRVACPEKGIPVIGIPFQTDYGQVHLTIGLENIITYE